MSRLRLAGRSTPSSPKPNISPKSVYVTAASSNGTRSDWIQSFTFVDGPAGCAPGIDPAAVIALRLERRLG